MTVSEIPRIVRKLPRGGMIWCEACEGFWFRDERGEIGHIRTGGPRCKYDKLMEFMEGNT